MIVTEPLMKQFAERTVKDGPQYIYGWLAHPYDGCYHLHIVCFIRGRHAFLSVDLGETRYAKYQAECPDYLLKTCGEKYLEAGCILLEDLEKILDGPGYDALEIHPVTDLESNTPYGIYEGVMRMALGLGMNLEGQFLCPECERPLYEGEYIEYNSSEFRGNGGIGIEPGAPICGECYSLGYCSYCGSDGLESFQNNIETGDGCADRCMYCAPDIRCSKCDEMIYANRIETPARRKAYDAGICEDCGDYEEEA